METPASLLDQLKNRPDEATWQRFFDLYTPLLKKWLYPFRIQDADESDLIQQTLSAVFKGLPEFRHNERRGAFRRWLRTTLVHRALAFFRDRKRQPSSLASEDVLGQLQALEDHSSELSRQWDREHDQFVIQRLTDMIRKEFQPKTWIAFERLVAGDSLEDAARTAGISSNAAVIAKCRVLNRLRQLVQGLVD